MAGGSAPSTDPSGASDPPTGGATPRTGAAPSFDLTPGTDLFAGRYRLLELLKTGNGVDTLRAEDLVSGAAVVLKIIDTSLVPTAARLRFQHETEVLRTLTGAGMVTLHDAGAGGECLYLAQDFVPGHTLQARLQGGPLPALPALRIAYEVAAALDIAHGAGICHRDVKPANILVDGPDDALGATLVDFGFARSSLLDASIRDDLVGTVRYLAPESTGSLAAPSDERSDLYALGVVLFECLAGEPPFTGPTVTDLLRQHLSAPVPDLRGRGSGVPRALDDIVQRLLRKDPGERYQSAAALMGDLRAVLEAMDRGDADPAVVIGRHDRRSTLTDPAFVGREREVERLTRFAAGLSGRAGGYTQAAGAGGVVLLEADSGGGKSRLLSEVMTRAASNGVRVLSGQGVALSGQRPYTLLRGVFEGIAEHLADPEVRRRVSAEVADVAATLRRVVVPALADALGSAPEQNPGPEQFGELRSLVALRRLLAAVATPDHPVLLVLDDCQWADTLTVRLLTELFAGPDAPVHLGVIAAFRSEEVPTGHPLRRVPAVSSISLGALTPDAVAALAASMAGPLPAEASELITRLADGNPFMAAAVLRGLVESGALLSGPSGWQVDVVRLHDVQASRRAAVFLVRRLELLDADALSLLSVGAVLGKQFDLDVAVQVAQLPAAPGQVVDEARRRRLLWVDASGRCNFFHDKIREALLERLGENERRRLHGRAADHFLQLVGERPGDAVFDLAYHLDAAGRHDEAVPYALAGADVSRARYGLDAAAAHYRIAARGAGDDDAGVQIAIAEGLGEVLTLQGVYAEARECFESARRWVSTPSKAAALDGKLGDLAFKTGDVAAAKAHIEGALARLGRSIPRSHPVFLGAAVLWELLVQAVHTALPRLFVGRRRGRRDEDDFLAMRLYSRLTYIYWFHSGMLCCAWAHFRGLNLAERYGPSAELGQAYSEHAPVMTMLPWFARGIRYARRSLEIRRELGDVWGQGQSLGFLGVGLYGASLFDEAEQACEEAIRLLRQTGDQWEVNTAGWHVALCQWRRGELVRAVETARAVHHAATTIGDRTAAGIALAIWTRCADGRIDAALLNEQLAAGDDDAHTATEVQLGAALNRRADGDLDGAAAFLAAALATVRRAGLRQDYIAPVFPWAATIARERVLATPDLAPRTRARRLREAARAARRARRWAAAYRNNQPHALRECALVAALRGRERTARRHLARSVAVADAQGARYEATASRLALAKLDQATADATADIARFDERVEQLRAELRILRPGEHPETSEQESISLFDRFATLLNVGHAITAAANHTALEEAIRDAASTLLRAERCHLVSLSTLDAEDDRLTTESGEELYGASQSLLRRAVSEGAPVVSIEAAGDPNESLLLSGVRSALVAPILVSGSPTSCLYATHRQVGALFGDEEVQLASFIATLAGAALEHLAGNEARFRSLAQNSSDVITLLDRDGALTYQSAAVTRVFGYAPSTWRGRSLSEWVHPDDRATFEVALASASQERDTRIECRFRHADGTYRVAETAVTNLLDDPTVGALVLNTRDVTARRRAEAELRSKNVELERANRAKSMFLASMSHELRTPLNAIIGFTGTLLMELPGPLNPEQSRQLGTVQQSGKLLLSIINDLLDLAKIESGTVQVALGSVDCGHVVDEVIRTLQPLAGAKNLRLDLQVPSEPVRVHSDARALGQILINLVNNAVKFTDTGIVRVEVTGDASAGGDGKVRIAVSDTGPGIDADDLTRIFEAFDRGTDPAAAYREGSGLGLHICRKLADVIGAGLEVDSAPGSGSTFTVVLDRHRPGAPAARSLVGSVPAGGEN